MGLDHTSIDRFTRARGRRKKSGASRRNAINSAKMSKNLAGRGAFHSGRARKDLSRFGN